LASPKIELTGIQVWCTSFEVGESESNESHKFFYEKNRWLEKFLKPILMGISAKLGWDFLASDMVVYWRVPLSLTQVIGEVKCFCQIPVVKTIPYASCMAYLSTFGLNLW